MELDSIEPPRCRRADGVWRDGETGMEELRQGRREEARQSGRRRKGRSKDARQGGGRKRGSPSNEAEE